MKKLILFLFLFLAGLSQVNANNGTYGDFSFSGSMIQYKTVSYDTGINSDVVGAMCIYNYYYICDVYYSNGTEKYISWNNYGSLDSTYSFSYNVFYNSIHYWNASGNLWYSFPSGYFQIVNNNFNYGYGDLVNTPIDGNPSFYIDGVFYPSIPAGDCTTETIPSFEFLNIFPTSSGSINEIIESPSENTYAMATTEMQAIFLGAEDVDGFPQLITSNDSMSFKTENKFGAKKTSLSFLTIKENIQYLKILGDYGLVDIYIYDEKNNLINTYKQIDLASYSEGKGFPVGGRGKLVNVIFSNTIFSHTIDSIELYTIGSNSTREVEICYYSDDDSYTIDGEIYDGDPYADLVGEPTPTEITFSDEGFQFFQNGFCLKNFIPFPSGGELSFDIKNPNGELKRTYSLYSSGLRSYGNNTCTLISTNYHNIAGQYYVRAVYEYQNVEYFPMGENFYQYTIDSPESIPSELPEDYFNNDSCDNDGALGYVGGFFCEISTFFSSIFSQIRENLGKLIVSMKDLMYEFSKLGVPEAGAQYIDYDATGALNTVQNYLIDNMTVPEDSRAMQFWDYYRYAMFGVLAMMVFSILFLIFKK